MKVGDPSTLAIESTITQAFEDIGMRGLGFFVLQIGGLEYGVREPEATLLACSFDQVGKRLLSRGKHTAPFSENDAGEVADAFRDAIFAQGQENATFFGLTQNAFCDVVYSNEVQWAPDGDEAFDDSSYVLQFDVGERVRLVAFKLGQNNHHDAATLRDVWLDAERFYTLLRHWHHAFEEEWRSAPKSSTASD